MPSTVLIDRKSELVGVTAIPLSVIRSFFSAVGEVFQLRINYDTRTVDLLRSEQARQKAEDDYRAAQDARRRASETRRAAEEAVKAAKASGDATMTARADTALVDAVAAETDAVEDEAVAEETLGRQPPTEAAADRSDGGSRRSRVTRRRSAPARPG